MTPSVEGELGGGFEGLECQQFVSVVFILFSTGGDLSRKAALEVVDQGVEAIKNGDDAFLIFERWNLNLNFLQCIRIKLRLTG